MDEPGLDFGGVTRDMYCAFWASACESYFDGSNVLVPLMQAGMDQTTFVQFGRVLAHGFLTCQLLPIRIAFPALACSLISTSVAISDWIFLATFLDFLAPFEGEIISEALTEAEHLDVKDFPQKLAVESILGRFGAIKLPSKRNLKNLIKDIAELLFVIQPCLHATWCIAAFLLSMCSFGLLWPQMSFKPCIKVCLFQRRELLTHLLSHPHIPIQMKREFMVICYSV